jgi:diaminopimelate epimerase
MRTPHFTKMHASGNDFICLDNRAGAYDSLIADAMARERFIVALCERRLGVGGDGVIFAEASDANAAIADSAPFDDVNSETIAARFFDADGTEEMLCGNGVACFTKWALDERLVRTAEVDIQTGAGLVHGKTIGDSRYRVCVPAPTDLELELTLTAGGKEYRAAFLQVGVPHLIVPVDDVEKVNVGAEGKALRHHPRFAGVGGVNVNFVEVLAEGEIKIRTFEVGVEDETLSCGTGSTASAIVTCLQNNWRTAYRENAAPVKVHSRGGETLLIWFTIGADNRIDETCLETTVHLVCRGTLAEEFARF